MKRQEILFNIPKNLLPHLKYKHPFVYLECGRLEIDERSVKFISDKGIITHLPCGIINCILLGPGTTITHDAIKILAEYNCNIFWTGEDGITKFYAAGLTPTHNSKNFNKQCKLAFNEKTNLDIAKKMFLKRFPNENISELTLNQLKGLEGFKIKEIYHNLAEKYSVNWKFRNAHLTEFYKIDETNQYITELNQYLYVVLCSATLAMGFSPYIGFVHKNSPLPFIYDMADLYKEELTIRPAFELYGLNVQKQELIDMFIGRAQNIKLLDTFAKDMNDLFGVSYDSNSCE